MAISICGGCQHQINGNVRQCPLCGGTMSHQRPEQDKTCPRCQISMEIHHYRGYDLDQCPACEGLWLEPEEFASLTTSLDVFRDENSSPQYQKPAHVGAESYLPCASCNKVMSRQNYKAISGIQIDSCIHCGIWLDRDELQQIRNFIASGGLDKAQDRKIEKHGMAIDALDDRVSDLELMEKVLHKFKLKRILFRGF
ncbi:hypothetical protein HII17_14165 [Thalassotalea sp. M1531]|uniref:Transcription factor zinc-finger domain-containing protein n=1 Tax=Thalassotalea algicola TaxID=2716224 RepID=A0A7Y0Q7S8_9GAMM|nr:zf-TFIIB domain-containing protein [Thalassotalea algicola]NMP32703.1 hypothetical protein [Thalassotalea algicola]